MSDLPLRERTQLWPGSVRVRQPFPAALADVCICPLARQNIIFEVEFRPMPPPGRGSSPVLLSTLVLIAFGVCLLLTNNKLGILEDEVSILDAATQPASQILRLFLKGEGQHEHPPLSDLLLHEWIKIPSTSLTALRALSVFFYVSALFVLMVTSRTLAGGRAPLAMVWIVVLWPFGFHFGRLIGWYAFTLLLVSALTLAYWSFVTSPNWKKGVALVFLAIALLYTNYFGWAIILCLAFDFWWHYRQTVRSPVPVLLVTFSVLVVAFGPLWRIALELGRVHLSVETWQQKIISLAFNVFSVFVSESVAPWFLGLSIPVGLAICICIGVVMLYGTGFPRRLFFYFFLLMIAMACAGIIGTKRLLFISGWLLVPLAVAVQNITSKQARRLLIVCLAGIASAGWFGIFSRHYYSTPHFIEPWPEIARDVAHALSEGAEVIGSHPSFFFYLHQELVGPGASYTRSYPSQGQDHSQTYDTEAWLNSDHPTRPRTLLIETVAVPSESELRQAQDWLDSRCSLRQDQRLAPDFGYLIKRRFFPTMGQRAWRIEVRDYACKSDAPN